MEALKKVLNQTSWQILGKIISSISTIFILAIISRNYGTSGVGIFTLALTYLATFYLLVDLGLNGYLLPRIKNESDDFNRLLGTRLRLSSLVMLVAFIGALILPVGGDDFIYSVILGLLSVVCFGVFNSTNLIFQKRLKYEYSNIATVVGAVTVFPVIYFLTLNNAPVYLLALGPIVGWLINNLLALFLVKKFVQVRASIPSIKADIKLFRNIWPIALTLFLNSLYFRVDSFLLSYFKGIEAVGIYNYAYQFFQTALTIPTFVMNGFYPILLKSKEENFGKFKKQVLVGCILLLMVAFGGLLLTYLLGPILLPLISGTGFEDSVKVLNVLALSFPAYFASALMMWTLMVLRQYKSLFFCYLIGLLINVFLNFLLIPKYSYFGAAAVTGISEYLILLLQAIILLKVFREEKE